MKRIFFIIIFITQNVMADGLQITNVIEGEGAEIIKHSKIQVHYTGKLQDGTKFDSSYDRGQPATFGVKGVIVGWQEVLQKMPVGSKWEVFIPQNLGYGTSGVPSDINKGEYVIPPSSTLIFEIELLSIVK